MVQPFALLLFTWCSRLSCVLSSQHFVWLFTSSLIIQCSNGLYLITRPNSTTIRLHNFRDSATLALRLVSPVRWYTLCRFFWSLGSALIPFCQCRQCPTPSVGHGFRPWWPCARCPTAAKVLYCSRGGLKGWARYVGPDVFFGQLVGYPVQPRGGLTVAPLPTFAPVGGLGGLMLQTSRPRLARLARLPCLLPWPRPWLAWWRPWWPRLAPCALPCAWQP